MSLLAEADGEQAAWVGPFEFRERTGVTSEIQGNSQAAARLATHEGEKVDLHDEIGPYGGQHR